MVNNGISFYEYCTCSAGRKELAVLCLSFGQNPQPILQVYNCYFVVST